MQNNTELKIDANTHLYLSDIPLTTRELEKYFGCKPRKSSQEHTRYEWIFEYNGNIYSIYDWSYMDSTFDEYYQTEWYLGGSHSRDIKMILEALSTKPPIKVIEVESVIEW